ncbi:MAG: recombinase family protein [Oscillospiraceae bacterium]|jgi:DNA invertase Pin-like site-specific DNA recombinase|nr:recombinase family protein [Oscillospiraceae bacterium]
MSRDPHVSDIVAHTHCVCWKTAMYIRLSREDGPEESYSVANQRALLLEHIQKSGGELLPSGTYIDDGFTGTDTNRAGFLGLIRDIRAGKINCVLVRDLSRLSRNYYEAGYYLDNFFIRMDVRFIALEYPAIDSYRHPEQMNSVLIPMQNVINDDFCRQTSMKVRSVFDMKRRKGEFIGAFAPYGYAKDPKDRHHLIVDPEAAETVRAIFLWFTGGGLSKKSIAEKLDTLGIPNPSAYKRLKEPHYHNPHCSPTSRGWSAATISGILSNPVYMGDMAQGKARVKSYKIHTQIRIPEDEWIVVSGTHEALIERPLFEQAAALSRKRRRQPSHSKTIYPLSGLLFCSACASPMHRTTKGPYAYYICSRYKKYAKAGCTRHCIRADELETAVIDAAKRVITLSGRDACGASETASFALTRKGRLNELEQAYFYRDGLYEKLMDGTITRDTYARLHEQYSAQIAGLELAVDDMAHTAACTHQDHASSDHALLFSLIDSVRVDEGYAITILFKCSNPFCGKQTKNRP